MLAANPDLGQPTQCAFDSRAIAVDDVSEGGTLYVAATGKPYPIEVVKDGGKGGTVVFDRWNEPVTLVAPADAIDITKLQSAH